MKDFLIKWGKHPLVVNLLVAVLVSCGVLCATLKWIDAYTLHNKAVQVPDIKGLQVEEAGRLLANIGLSYSVIDSVFSKNVKPGAVVEFQPTYKDRVKKGRTILITVNALSSQMAAIPLMMNASSRQALASLKALGFESIEIEYVSGYEDLTMGVELRGRLLEEGEMVQLSAPLVLKVGNGNLYGGMDGDSLSPEAEAEEPLNSDVETWF
ncbi:MAG: PASTA domain-containing protein [Tannerellaceae bacterium]|jgi:hypothetical protein|nr:PASTA domain-containing protein [Tannerellaceae bacterium]